MKLSSKSARLGGVAALAACCALMAFASLAAAAGPTTITFKELEKGSTFSFIDNAPKTKQNKNGPEKISAGDEIVITNPLEAQGKQIGRLHAFCVATQTSKNFAKAGFLCTGIFAFSGKGTLVASVLIGSGNLTGAITGGTGTYAGARGTFVSKEGKGSSTVTVTLIE